jgi:hypothetical protein
MICDLYKVKKVIYILIFFCCFQLGNLRADAQCAMCTKTASQLGEKPAIGLNNAILYLMFAPLAIMGYLGYRWYKNQQVEETDAEPGSHA